MATILAVDDSEPIRQMISLALQSGGHSVVLASDGQDGFAKFSAGRFDLVITDINMPVMDGYHLIRSIRGHNNQVPILALTTEASDEKRQNGEKAGVNGWVVKPFKAPQFLAIVKQILL